MRHEFFPGMILLLLAVGVIGYRFSAMEKPPAPSHIQALGVGEDGAFINIPFFRKTVWEPYRDRFGDSLIHLLVFIDLDVECPSHVFETGEWVNLVHSVDPSIFKCSLFMPDTVSRDLVQAYCDTYLLKMDDVTFYDPSTKVSLYDDLGLFKVCWSLEDEFLWCELGSASPYDHAETLSRLEALLIPLME